MGVRFRGQVSSVPGIIQRLVRVSILEHIIT